MFMITGHAKKSPPTALVLFPSYSTAAQYLWQWGVKKTHSELFDVVESPTQTITLEEAFGNAEFRSGFNSKNANGVVAFESLTIEQVDFGQPLG